MKYLSKIAIYAFLSLSLPSSLFSQAPRDSYDLAKKKYHVYVTDGDGQYASSGEYWFKPKSKGFYSVESIINISPSVGLYFYNKTSTSTGEILYFDSAVGAGVTMKLEWDSSDGGTFELFGLGWQKGYFTAHDWNEEGESLILNVDRQEYIGSGNKRVIITSDELGDGLTLQYSFDSNDEGNYGMHWLFPTEDRFGNPESAYHFDGENSLITVPENDLIDFDVENNFTISIWAKLSLEDEGSILLGKDEGPGNRPKWYLYIGPTPNSDLQKRLVFYFNDKKFNGHWMGDDKSLSWDSESWHHIVVTKESKRFSLYLDGLLHSSEETDAVMSSKIMAPLTIGRAEKNSILGELDDIRIYNRAFNEELVLSLYQHESIPQFLYRPIRIKTNSKETPSFPYEKTFLVRKSKGDFRFACKSDALPDRFQVIVNEAIIYDSKYVGASNMYTAQDGIRDSLEFYKLHGNEIQKKLAESELSYLECCNAIDSNGGFFEEYKVYGFEKPYGVEEITVKVISPMSHNSPLGSIYNSGSHWEFSLERVNVSAPEMTIKMLKSGLLEIRAKTKKGVLNRLETSKDLKDWSQLGVGFEFFGDGGEATFKLLPDSDFKFFRFLWLN